MPRIPIRILSLAIVLAAGSVPAAPRSPSRALATKTAVSRDAEIAAAVAPVFVQGLGDTPRFDYITRFDFDGDWKGDNNWSNAEKTQYPLDAYVYFDVKETETHVFVQYACFHPRDYKGGSTKGVILSNLIQAGTEKYGKYDPTGKSDEAVLAHENDLEGCVVVAKKKGPGATDLNVVFVETLAHNKFLKYVAGTVTKNNFERVPMDGEHPLLFVEPKGHGIEASAGATADAKREAVKSLLTYRVTGAADDPDKRSGDGVGYALIPMESTLWRQAAGAPNDTYAETSTFGTFSVKTAGAKPGTRTAKVGTLGSAFNGKEGGKNMARPPWGWFDSAEKDRPLGEWFFDPAGTINRHFTTGSKFSLVYVQNRPLGIQPK